MEPETTDVPEQDEKKSEWERPTFERLDAAEAELGLGVGADLIIIGTS